MKDRLDKYDSFVKALRVVRDIFEASDYVFGRLRLMALDKNMEHNIICQ